MRKTSFWRRLKELYEIEYGIVASVFVTIPFLCIAFQTLVYNIHKNLKGNFTMDIITKPVIGSEMIGSGGNLSGASTGAPCRSERTAKYNRLLMIEDELKGGKAL